MRDQVLRWRHAIVAISGHLDAQPLAAYVCLVQGLAKGDKMETVIRHATELGVSEFIPSPPQEAS